MSFSKLMKYGLEFFGRYYSTYQGVVIENEDPSHMGRIKVKIPTVHSGLEVICNPKCPGGANCGARYLIPRIGEIVWVEFMNGSPQNGLYSYHGWFLDQTPEEFVPNNNFGFITPHGHKVIVEDGPEGKLTVQFFAEDGKSSTTLRVEGDNLYLTQGSTKWNLSDFNSLIEALRLDLLAAKSGTQLSNWINLNKSQEA